MVFPAWKAAISSSEYAEQSQWLEEIEHRVFGKDGAEDALARVAAPSAHSAWSTFRS
jgi:hypothetical protein